jgi:hypothetical protein
VDFKYNEFMDGAENLCGVGEILSYSADCLFRSMPLVERELECSYCSMCCSEQIDGTGGCVANTNNDL